MNEILTLSVDEVARDIALDCKLFCETILTSKDRGASASYILNRWARYYLLAEGRATWKDIVFALRDDYKTLVEHIGNQALLSDSDRKIVEHAKRMLHVTDDEYQVAINKAAPIIKSTIESTIQSIIN